MKTIITLLSLSFLLSAFSAPDPVVDIFHKNLRTGVNYFILAADQSRGGGLTLVTGSNNTCPMYVAQRANFWGQRLTFSPVNPKKGVIRESTDLNIKFSTRATTCAGSPVWKLKYNTSTKQYFVAIGGVEGNPGRETINNWFKIEKYNNGYKIVFCPTVCKFCKVICKDVGMFIDDQGTRRLALSDVPFAVNFWETP